MSPIGLEVPVFGASAAIHAIKAGASRIELNAAGSYPAGGLTPSLEDLQNVASSLNSVPLRIMIRPRGPPPPPPPTTTTTSMSADNTITADAARSAPQISTHSQGRDFIYSDEEIERMYDDIMKFKASGFLDVERGDGFVFGILTEKSRVEGCEVDVARCTRLVTAARPFKTVFHRAFDEVVSCGGSSLDDSGRLSWQKSLDDLACCGFDGILTSGGLGSAVQNAETLALILDEAAEVDIEIIVGGGVRSKNVPELLQTLRLSERTQQRVFMHSSCLTTGETKHVDPLKVEAIVRHLK